MRKDVRINTETTIYHHMRFSKTGNMEILK